VDNPWVGGSYRRMTNLAQVQCTDRLVLELVTALLRQSSRPPVTVIVGDHGPRFTDIGFCGHPERVSAFNRERAARRAP
jgi:hypothetical protein